MKVVVTGGAGFIGANLCRNLQAQEWVDEVRVIDDLSTGHASSLEGLDVGLEQRSILELSRLESVAAGADAIVHLAALGSVPRSVKDPMASHHANATGTLNVLNVARQNNSHVVLASSSSVYGANPAIPKVESLQAMPMSPYAVSKLASEQYAMAFAQCYGLDVSPFRFFNVFGPGQMPGHAYAAVVPTFVDAALRGIPLPVHGDGEQSRDFTYVGTVVEIVAAALKRRVTTGPTNLAFGSRTTLNRLIEAIERQLNTTVQVDRQPTRPGDVRHSQADSGLLRNLFPDVQPVSLDVGLASTIDWMGRHIADTDDTRSARDARA